MGNGARVADIVIQVLIHLLFITPTWLPDVYYHFSQLP